MRTMMVQDAARDLTRVVRELREGEPVQLIEDGQVAAVLLHPDEFESLIETLAWLRDPHVADDVRRARLALAHGRTVNGDAVRDRHLGPTT